MKTHTLCLPILCVGLFAARVVCAQSPPTAPYQQDNLESLKKQMREMQASVQQLQARHQQELDALKAQVERQQKVIADLQRAVSAGTVPPLRPETHKTAATATKPPTGPETLFPTIDDSVVAATLPPAQASTAATSAPAAFPTADTSVTSVAAASNARSLTAPITIAGGGRNYMNISLDGLFAGAISTERDFERLEPGGHDPIQRGFTVQNIELTLQGAVDPFFEAFSTVVFQLDREAETNVELEEAWLQTTSLPWGLQVKGGQFLSPFGRQNQIHPHAFDFVDTTLANARLLGPDSLRSAGLQIAWLAPVPWFSELAVAAQNGNGETGYLFRNRGDHDVFYERATLDRQLRGPQDLTYVTRWTNAFDLSPTQTMLTGVSGAFGPNRASQT